MARQSAVKPICHTIKVASGGNGVCGRKRKLCAAHKAAGTNAIRASFDVCEGYLRLGSVVRRVDVTHILCALEDAEGERGEEVASGEQTRSGAQREASVLAQEIGHLLQLGQTMIDEDLLVLQLLEGGTVLGASVFRSQILHGAEDRTPGLDLHVGVVDVWDRISVLESESDLGNFLATLAVNLVGESRVVHVEIGLVFGHQMVAVIQLRGMLGKPRSLHTDVVLGQQIHAAERARLAQRTDQLQQIATSHVQLDEHIMIDALNARLARLDMLHSAVERFDGLQDAAQRGDALLEAHHECGTLYGCLRLGGLRCGISEHNLVLGETVICNYKRWQRKAISTGAQSDLAVT